MHLVRSLPFALLAAGVVSLVAAVATGEATFYLVLVVPVLTGSSGLPLLGVVLLFLGFLTLPLGFPTDAHEGNDVLLSSAPSSPRGPTPRSSSGSGGVILLGPVPIFFGSWKDPSSRVYWVAVLVGVVVLAVALGLLALAWL